LFIPLSSLTSRAINESSQNQPEEPGRPRAVQAQQRGWQPLARRALGVQSRRASCDKRRRAMACFESRFIRTAIPNGNSRAVLHPARATAFSELLKKVRSFQSLLLCLRALDLNTSTLGITEGRDLNLFRQTHYQTFLIFTPMIF